MADALYIHTPFCVRKCPYCDFFKVARPDPGTGAAPDDGAWLRALEAEARQWRDECPAPRTVFIGGGTPSALTHDELRQLFDMLHDVFDLGRVVEFTSEANPNSLTPAKARMMADAGVNRLSIGVQSLDERALQFLGRAHSAADVPRAFAAAREAGITNLSLDLISALGPAAGVTEPDRTLADVERALNDPEIGPLAHISVYTLIIEEGTPFHTRAARGEALAADEDVEAECFERVAQRVAQAGFERYEISNHAQPGAECRHNLAYWRCEPWLGIGPSAHSFSGRSRRGNVRDLRAWSRALDPQSGGNARDAIAFTEELTALQVIEERLLMGMRLATGVNLPDAAAAATAIDPGTDWSATLAALPHSAQDLIDRGLLAWDDPVIRLTPAGFPLCDALILELATRLDRQPT